MARIFTDPKILVVKTTSKVQLWACELTGYGSHSYIGLRTDSGWLLR